VPEDSVAFLVPPAVNSTASPELEYKPVFASSIKAMPGFA